MRLVLFLSCCCLFVLFCVGVCCHLGVVVFVGDLRCFSSFFFVCVCVGCCSHCCWHAHFVTVFFVVGVSFAVGV